MKAVSFWDCTGMCANKVINIRLRAYFFSGTMAIRILYSPPRWGAIPSQAIRKIHAGFQPSYLGPAEINGYGQSFHDSRITQSIPPQ
jgi:hypothetical protein